MDATAVQTLLDSIQNAATMQERQDRIIDTIGVVDDEVRKNAAAIAKYDFFPVTLTRNTDMITNVGTIEMAVRGDGKSVSIMLDNIIPIVACSKGYMLTLATLSLSAPYQNDAHKALATKVKQHPLRYCGSARTNGADGTRKVAVLGVSIGSNELVVNIITNETFPANSNFNGTITWNMV